MNRILWTSLALLGIAATAGAVAVSCHGGSDSAAPPPIDDTLGATCEKPLPLDRRIVLGAFPDNATVLPISGNPNEALPNGGVALVRDGATHALAINVPGQPLRTVPDSNNAVTVIGSGMPGTDAKLLVFSRAALTARAKFAGKVVYEVDPAGWSLEVRVVDPTGTVVASKSLPSAGEAVVPMSIETSAPQGAAVLVQFDGRGVPGRVRGAGDPPITMQIFTIGWANGQLSVDGQEREPVTEEDLKQLSDMFIAPLTCPPRGCGTAVDAHGRTFDCGGCLDGEVCVQNACRPTSEVDGGACVPLDKPLACVDGACGLVSDGCSALVDCGGCAEGQQCGAVTPGKCGNPNTSYPEDVRAAFGGTKVCGCFTDVGGTIDVKCDDKESCVAGVCQGDQ